RPALTQKLQEKMKISGPARDNTTSSASKRAARNRTPKKEGCAMKTKSLWIWATMVGLLSGCGASMHDVAPVDVRAGSTVGVRVAGGRRRGVFVVDESELVGIALSAEHGDGWRWRVETEMGAGSGCAGRISGGRVSRCGPLAPGRYLVRVSDVGGIEQRPSWL